MKYRSNSSARVLSLATLILGAGLLSPTASAAEPSAAPPQPPVIELGTRFLPDTAGTGDPVVLTVLAQPPEEQASLPSSTFTVLYPSSELTYESASAGTCVSYPSIGYVTCDVAPSTEGMNFYFTVTKQADGTATANTIMRVAHHDTAPSYARDTAELTVAGTR